MQVNDYVISLLSKKFFSQPLPIRLQFWDGRSTDLGPDPQVCLTFTTPKAARHFLSPNLDNLGCAYVEGEIDIEGSLPEVMRIADQVIARRSASRRDLMLLNWLLTRHNKKHDAEAVRYHYDVSNDFYALWLDPQMIYSCAYFKTGNESLAQAQEQKLDHICRKLNLQPGEQFLDIGCGWGGLICWAAKHYGVRALGVTLSEKQYAFAKARVQSEGLSNWVDVQLRDYRDIPGEALYDKIASVGMFEHVGLKNLPIYFQVIHKLLKPGGLFLNHGITTRNPDDDTSGPNRASFIHRYVFPEGELPHISLVSADMERQALEVLDIESLRPHYAQTLMHWTSRLESQRQKAIELVGEKRYRIWRIYMAGCAHGFQHGWISIYQVLASRLSEEGLSGFAWSREYQYKNDPKPSPYQRAEAQWPRLPPQHAEKKSA